MASDELMLFDYVVGILFVYFLHITSFLTECVSIKTYCLFDLFLI